jgi:hypothetical protein
MVGLTRFLFLMNLCEKNGGSANVYAGSGLSKNGRSFHVVEKHFVLQETVTPPPVIDSRMCARKSSSKYSPEKRRM